MGLLEDAIREHLDLKRSRGADPSEIERLEQEALGPVRREPVPGNDRFEPAGGVSDHSPIEYHDSTAPHWQQDEDFGEHLADGQGSDAPEPEPGKRRGFLRRSRGASTPEREHAPEPEPQHGWSDYDEADADFEDDRFGAAYVASPEDHFPGTGFDEPQPGTVDSYEDLLSSHQVDEHFHEPDPTTDGLDAHPQAGGRFEPDNGPPTEVYQAVPEPVAEVDLASPPHEVERIAPPAAAPTVGAHHPILDDLPFHESTSEEPVDRAQAEEPASRTELVAAEPEPSLAREPEPSDSPPEAAAAAPAGGDEPPQLQFDRAPQRPTFTAEPPRLGDSDEAPPKPPSRSKPKRGDELQGTLEFDVAGEPGDDEDVLEVTPDFLQDTPEHDRLWFEQRPPKDFDFDG